MSFLFIWLLKIGRRLGSFLIAIPTALGVPGVNFWSAICRSSFRWTFTADARRKNQRNVPIDPFATHCSVNIIVSIFVLKIPCVPITSRRNATDLWPLTWCRWFTADPIIHYIFRSDPTSTPWISTVLKVWRIISRNWWLTTSSTWVTFAGDGNMLSILHQKIRGVNYVKCWETQKRKRKCTTLHRGGPVRRSTKPVCCYHQNLLFLLKMTMMTGSFFKNTHFNRSALIRLLDLAQ